MISWLKPGYLDPKLETLESPPLPKDPPGRLLPTPLWKGPPHRLRRGVRVALRARGGGGCGGLKGLGMTWGAAGTR